MVYLQLQLSILRKQEFVLPTPLNLAMARGMYNPILLLHALATIVSASTSCYFPDGETATGNYACNPSAETSVCCGTNSACLSNGLCLANGVELIRGACTDQSWLSDACP